ncbi:MAG: FkbM family methyltransferase [Sphingobacteriia bacterium]|nr:FkbM family methyltransferase [Sphingobacteriia bacterium]NCC40608.1 FkbM family methyltransferase [Gammaproteobacteria bacterium]
MRWRERLRATYGVLRSLRIYYAQPHRARLDDFYRAWIASGELVFDIGSHVGDRVGCFRRLGARVLAVEPQPALARALGWLYGRDAGVRIEPVAVGRVAGRAELRLSLANPTISTLSPGFIAAARTAPGWQDQRWDACIGVACTTLDELIDRHGLPSFIKIDVEGHEAEVLAGLTRPVPALSFELTTIQKDVAQQALRECQRLGFTRFNAVLGESFSYVHETWCDAESIARWIEMLPLAANSGDIYAAWDLERTIPRLGVSFLSLARLSCVS